MKEQDYINVGVRKDCIPDAFECAKRASKNGRFHGVTVRKLFKDIVENPSQFENDLDFAPLARKLLIPIPPEKKLFFHDKPVPYKIFGREHIADNAIEQMNTVCELPPAVKGALNADAHWCYVIPVGGVLALDNAVCPTIVGSDISCRMRLSIIDYPVKELHKELRSGMRRGDKLSEAILEGTKFGPNGVHQNKMNHPVMDKNWNMTQVTKAVKDRAWHQLGTSGDSNHFVDIGIVNLKEDVVFDRPLPKGEYLAILSHSGSRAAGAAVCREYDNIAKSKLPKQYEKFKFLPWLEMDTQEGIEYWNAMNLMNEYAVACHDVIHENVCNLLGAEILAIVQNDHNLAWKEMVDGRELYVHRKGATPAGKGVLGIIPSSMASPAIIVRGKGNVDSINSCSHGAGRKLSRTQAKKTLNSHAWKSSLKEKGIRLLAGGLDESPDAYKDIKDVMAAQTELVDVIAEFQPKIVRMADER